MLFDKEDYRQSKAQVIDLIKATHDWQGMEGFIADGIICPDIYADQPLKILVFLGESYGYSQCGMVDIEDQLKKDILGVGHHNRQTSKKVSALLWLLHQSYREGRKFTDDDLPYLFQNKTEYIKDLQDALSRSAWVNVKKASKHIDEFGNNATRQDYMEVYRAGIKNEKILQHQIDSIKPNIVIVCSYPVFDSLYKLRLLGEDIKRDKKYQVQLNERNQIVVQVNHPSDYRKWNYKGILQLYGLIYEALNQFNPALQKSSVEYPS
ncbi:MAG: hypothetical protein ACTHMI_24085 [Mucilaginibacter sp.]